MLIALTLRGLALSQVTGQLSSPDNQVPASSCNDRSISGIIWSCLTTIFACTWIAIHPNIPQHGERPIVRRLKIFVTAIIAPELIILWSLRQWFASRRLARELKDYGWTQTHGFFAIMGGFQICESERTPRHIDDPDDLLPYLVEKQITISEEEILDRSKGDILSKIIVLLQVSWFILQVLARAIQHLPITELEISTIAFAALNFVTYFCWWNKPYDVQYPIIIRASHSTSQNTGSISAEDASELDLEDNPLHSLNDSAATSRPSPRPESSFDTDSHPLSALHQPLLGSTALATGHRALADLTPHTPSICPDSHPWPLPPDILASFAPSPRAKSGARGLLLGFDVQITCSKVWRGLWSGLSSILTALGHIILTCVDWTGAVLIGGDPETAYYGGATLEAEHYVTVTLACLLAMAFGAIHCLAWEFDFPTEAEGWLWRASSITIAFVPIVITSTTQTRGLEWLEWHLSIVLRQLVVTPMLVLGALSVVVYPLARLILLVEMFVPPRSPNPGIYTPVDWVSYIPHF
ncbi:hypothetical protein DXG01_017179 [Tephrocybe rancida]|nr:hypothetical protein DXG01_017179 [Tephrocybe rancida]